MSNFEITNGHTAVACPVRIDAGTYDGHPLYLHGDCGPSRDERLKQVGGDHYAKYAIQPWDIIDCYGLNYYEGTALKYLLRYRDKNGVEDLKKAQHFIDVLIAKYGSKDD